MQILNWTEFSNWQVISSHLNPLTLTVIGAPQMTLKQYLSTIPCLPLPWGNLQTLAHSLVLSSHLFFCLSLFLAPFSVPYRIVFAMPEDLVMLLYIWVSVSSPWLGGHHALQLNSWFCCEPPRSSHGLCRKCSEVSYSISSQRLGSFSRVCCQGLTLTGIKKDGKDERPHLLNLRSKHDVLVPLYDLQSKKRCCCLSYHGKNLWF